jgi:hypothetical protein
MKKLSLAALLLVVGTLLGATVLREPVADAATATLNVFVSNDSSHPVPVRETNTDTGGNIKVHEQGTAAVRSADEEVSVTQSVVQELTTTCRGDVYTVPAGKELVVEYLSAWVPDTVGNPTAAEGFFEVEGTLMLLPVKFERQAFDTFAASEAVHYVFPAGARIRFAVDLEGVSRCSVRFSLGGHLRPAS